MAAVPGTREHRHLVDERHERILPEGEGSGRWPFDERRRHNRDVPEATTVWAVDLLREPKKDRQGTLSLQPEHLVFEPRAQGAAVIRIPLRSIKKARRLRGSPVLLVVHERNGTNVEVAFYFVQPPPLEPVLGQGERPTPFSFGRASKRRARRQNVGYLGFSGRDKRQEIQGWARAVNEAMAGGNASAG
jgi:hypothetical protein